MNNSKILYVSKVMKYPPIGGPELRVSNSIKSLASITKLHVINLDCNADISTHKYFKSTDILYRYIDEFEAKPPNNYILKITKVILKILKNKTTNSRSRANYILDHMEKYNLEILWIGYGNISYQLISIIRKKNKSIKIICDTDSVWSRFILRESEYASLLRSLLIYYKGYKKIYEEKKLTNMCNVITAVSEFDAEYYKNMTKQINKVKVFSNTIDPKDYSSSQGISKSIKTTIYISGSFYSERSPMVLATKWFISEIFPKIQKEIPETNVKIIGKGSDKYFANISNNIEVLGFVDSVLPYLYSSSVAVVPLKFESGTRFKILEAGICKVPIVTTTLGLEGLNLADNTHLLVADDEVTFAEKVIKILSDSRLASKLAKECYKEILQSNTIRKSAREAEDIVEFLTN